MRSNWFRMRVSWFGLLGMMPIAFLTVHFSCDMALAQLPDEGIRILSEQKSYAEQQASILIELFNDKEISPQEYREGVSLYAQAKAAFDGWIDQLKYDLSAGVEIGESQRYMDALSKAAEKGNHFIAYVEEKSLGNLRGDIAGRLRNVFEAMQKAGHSIWAAAAGTATPQDQSQLAWLEQYKWKPFTEIKVQL